MIHDLSIRLVLSIAPAALFAVGCAGAPQAVVATAPDAHAAPAVVGGGERCVAIQRGRGGAVQDTRVAERWPDRTYGGQGVAIAGRVSTANNEMLLRFDLADIPAGAAITRATLTVEAATCPTQAVELVVHRVTSPWDEQGATWATFAGAFVEASATRLRVEAGTAPGALAMDVTPTLRSWVSGETENHGIVIRQEGASVALSTSEAIVLPHRPRLDVCFTPARPPAARAPQGT
jgi:hypothetical protein